MAEFVVIKSFLQRYDAELAKAALETYGIFSIVSADDCGGMRPYMSFGSAITLSVSKLDIEKACKILEPLT